MKTTIKALLSLTLCLVFLLGLASCGNKQDPNAPEGYVTASDECADYYLYVPSKWLVDTAKNSLMASARASQYTSTPNVTMMPCSDDASEYATIGDYWSYYKGTLEKVFDLAKDENGNTTDKSSFTLEGEPSSLKAGGRDAMKYVYTATLSGIELKYVQLIIKSGSTMHIFTYTATLDSYDEEQVNDIINNIKFKD